MFPRFADVLAAIDELKERGLIVDYAIGGAVALIFWDEAIPTFDIDVLVLLPEDTPRSPLAILEPIYAWAKERDYETRAEHIVISGIPVQFLPAPDTLSAEAVVQARTLDYQGRPLRVVSPEYLVAIWSKPPANTARRRERVAKLRESESRVLDETALSEILKRHGLAARLAPDASN